MSDLQWAIPLKYAELSTTIEECATNDQVYSTLYFSASDSEKTKGAQFVETKYAWSSIIRDPNSNWKPKWNPVEITQ